MGSNGRAAPQPGQPRVSPYEFLKNAIISGELSPGQPLVETALAEWCAVSRTPIREALRALQQDGLVERSDRGLTVRESSPEEILDVYYTRMVLEAAAGRVAAERRSDYDLRILRASLDACEKVSSEDAAAMADANQRFHRAVWLASHNESLIDLLERLNLHLARYPGTTLSAPGRWEEAIGEHRRLFEAIEHRKPDQAHDVAMHHFLTARDIRLSLFVSEASMR